MRRATIDRRLAIAGCGAALLLLAGGAGAAPAAGGDNGWQIETAESLGPGRFTSLKVDRQGNVHLAYSIEDGDVYPLRYVIRSASNGQWFGMSVAKGAGVCSLALDSKQRPHISWADFGSLQGARLRYARWDGSAWKAEPIRLNSEVVSYYNSIALDAKDNPAISFYEYQGPRETEFRIRLRTVMFTDGVWDLRTVDGQPGSGKFNAMAVDSKGRFHVAYANVSAGTAGMRYALWDGKTWKPEIVEGIEQNRGDNVGFSAAIALDKQDNPHLTYMNESTPMLKYAVRKQGRWIIQNVDSLARVAYPDRNSIAIDEQGRVYLGYHDPGRGILKVAHQEGARWVTEIVDTGGVGFTSSMEIADGVLWISYSDEKGFVKVAHKKIAGVAAGPESAASGRAGK